MRCICDRKLNSFLLNFLLQHSKKAAHIYSKSFKHMTIRIFLNMIVNF